MSNEEVFSEAHSWDRIAQVSKFAGGGVGLGAAAGAKTRAAAKAAMAARTGEFWSTFLGWLKMAPPAIFFAALQSVTGNSQTYWRLEMKRRAQSGEMNPEDIRRNHGDLK